MGAMTAALPAPSVAEIVARWSPQPVALGALVVAVTWYAWSLTRLQRAGTTPPWAKKRTVSFGLGAALLAWTTCGYPQVYARSLYWVWTSQMLILLLLVPVVLMAGQPIDLARRTRGNQAFAVRFVDSRAGRTFSNPLVGPVLIPALSAALFFGPLAGWAIGHELVGDTLPVLVVAAGALIVLPLVATGDERGSMAVALALTIGVFELLLDAIPGIALRLNTHLITSFFDYRTAHTWSPTPLHDQQLGGAVLWCVSEVIDLPFLLLIYVRWLRADARDAAEIDTVLEAERIARGQSMTGFDPADPADPGVNMPAGDEPWWLTDPTMRRRFGP
jgi:putative membrane protein